jgi:capsular polysaccharide biosynthesis protein
MVNTVSGNIIPESLLDVSVQASSQINNGVLPFTVTVKNMSRNQADNVSVTLDLDSTYFETVTAQSKSSLASNEQWVTSFNVTLKDNAYGQSHDISATATYTSAYTEITGQLAAVGSRTVSVAAKPESPAVPQDLMIYILLGVVAAAVVGVVAVVARR